MIRLGIDLGGTAIKYGLAEEGRLLGTGQIPTPLEEGYEAVLEAILRAGKEIMETAEAEEIGVATPGLIDAREGRILYSNNFAWENRHIARDLARLFHRPVRIANDAQAAALGEALYGAGKGYGRVAMITIGTGVGGGFVRNGEPEEDLYGGMAFIFGHMLYQRGGRRCNCGRTGCYEAYASAGALERDYRERTGRGNLLSAKEIFEAVSEDACAREAVSAFSAALGDLAADIANALRPEILVVGGGVSGSAELFLPAVREGLAEAYGAGFAPVKAAAAVLGNRAGILGAASLRTKAHRGED